MNKSTNEFRQPTEADSSTTDDGREASSPTAAKPTVSGSYSYDLIIKPVYGVDKTTAVHTYKVVNESGFLEQVLFVGSYIDCYNFRNNCR